MDKEQVNGHNDAREEEKETPLSGKTQTLAADQTGSSQGECIRNRIEKKVKLIKNSLGMSSPRDCFSYVVEA
jgi:hypothetical protein